MNIELVRDKSFTLMPGLSGKVHWVKQVREDLGIGLKAAKTLADYFERNDRMKMIINTHMIEDLEARLEIENAFRVRFSPRVRPVTVEIKDMVPATEPAETDPSDAVLKNAAIKLIRIGSIDRARDVLRILI